MVIYKVIYIYCCLQSYIYCWKYKKFANHEFYLLKKRGTPLHLIPQALVPTDILPTHICDICT